MVEARAVTILSWLQFGNPYQTVSCYTLRPGVDWHSERESANVPLLLLGWSLTRFGLSPVLATETIAIPFGEFLWQLSPWPQPALSPWPIGS
jgi:hypothetical protein